MLVFALSIASSIVAAIIMAATRKWWHDTKFALMTSETVRMLVPNVLRRDRELLEDRKRATTYLLKWLRQDQSRREPHLGEFGRRAAPEEERRFQNRVADFAAKPRLYLTGWPCFVLHQLQLGEHSLALAMAGMRRLLADGPVQARATVATHPEALATTANYRHTLRAV